MLPHRVLQKMASSESKNVCYNGLYWHLSIVCAHLQSIVFQVFDQVILVQLQEGLSVDKLRKVFPDESIDLIKKSTRTKNGPDIANVEVGLKWRHRKFSSKNSKNILFWSARGGPGGQGLSLALPWGRPWLILVWQGVLVGSKIVRILWRNLYTITGAYLHSSPIPTISSQYVLCWIWIYLK